MPPNDPEPRMEMRALVAVVLSMVVLSVYQYFFAPPPTPEAPTQRPVVEEPALPGPETAPEVAQGTESGPEARPLPAGEVIAAENARELVVEGADYTARITNEGGRISSFVLTEYHDEQGRTLDLVHPGARATDRLMLQLVTPDAPGRADTANGALHRLLVNGFPPSSRTIRVDDEPVEVELEWADGNGDFVRKRISFPPVGYQLGLEVDANLSDEPVWLQIGPGLNAVANRSRMAFLSEGAVLLDMEGNLEHWDTGDLESPVLQPRDYRWVALESNYFLGALLVEGPIDLRLAASPVPLPAAETPPEDAEEAPATEVTLVQLQVGIPEAGLDAPLLLSPKRYSLLVDQGHELQRVVDFGWFGIIARPLLFVLTWIQGYVANYGVAIILLTGLLWLIFLPLSHKGMVSMRRTQQLQPKMAAIRNKYKGSKDLEQRQKMNEEVMELYKKEGVSPLGGCLPMLVQLPILFAFYRLLSVAIELREAPFMLWIQDLSQHDPYYVLPLLMGATMLLQQRMTPTSGVNPTQARMMKLMPIVFTVLFLSVPSGLVLYWTTNNALRIGQQLYVNRMLDEKPAKSKKGKAGGQRGKRGKK